MFKLNKTFFSVCILIVLIVASGVCAFATTFYEKSYSQMPSTYQQRIDDAFYNNYLNYDGGPDHYYIDSFRTLCTAFSTVSSPNWTTTTNWTGTLLADNSVFTSYANTCSIAARCIYAECTNMTTQRQQCMRAVADVISNRSVYTSYGGPTINGVITKPGAFSCSRDGNIGFNNPMFYSSDVDAFAYAAMLDFHMVDGTPSGYILPNQYYFNFYDISLGMPFYIKVGDTYIQCTSSNVLQATHQKIGTTYVPLKTNAPMVKYGTTVFYSY